MHLATYTLVAIHQPLHLVTCGRGMDSRDGKAVLGQEATDLRKKVRGRSVGASPRLHVEDHRLRRVAEREPRRHRVACSVYLSGLRRRGYIKTDEFS